MEQQKFQPKNKSTGQDSKDESRQSQKKAKVQGYSQKVHESKLKPFYTKLNLYQSISYEYKTSQEQIINKLKLKIKEQNKTICQQQQIIDDQQKLIDSYQQKLDDCNTRYQNIVDLQSHLNKTFKEQSCQTTTFNQAREINQNLQKMQQAHNKNIIQMLYTFQTQKRNKQMSLYDDLRKSDNIDGYFSEKKTKNTFFTSQKMKAVKQNGKSELEGNDKSDDQTMIVNNNIQLVDNIYENYFIKDSEQLIQIQCQTVNQ